MEHLCHLVSILLDKRETMIKFPSFFYKFGFELLVI